MDPDLITTLIASELIARRSGAIDPAERRNISVRSLALASVGVPPVVTLVDAQSQVRRLQTRPAPAPVPGLGFQATGERIARELAAAAALAQDQIEKSEEQIKAAESALKEEKKALDEAKKQAEQLEGCAVAVGEVFSTN